MMTVPPAPSQQPPVGRFRLSSLDCGLGKVADRDGVGAAQGVEVDRLDAVEVHRDIGDVASEPPRVPLAEMSIFSLMLAPLNSKPVVARLTVDRVAAVARFQTNVSSPAPSGPMSLPWPPLTRSLPWLPVMLSFPSPPLIVRLIRPALSPDALMVSSPARPLTVS